MTKKRFYTKYDEQQQSALLQVLEVNFETRTIEAIGFVSTEINTLKLNVQNREELNIPFDNYIKYLKDDGYTYIGN